MATLPNANATASQYNERYGGSVWAKKEVSLALLHGLPLSFSHAL